MPQILLLERSHSGQSHRREGVRFRQDQQRYRQLHFFHLYPDGTEEEYAALAAVLDKAPCAELADVRRAGEWLTRLANVEDGFWRARMAQRWQSCCLRSAHLGLGVFRLFEEVLPAFRTEPPAGVARLRLACALRLRTTSPLYERLASIRRKVLGENFSLLDGLQNILRRTRMFSPLRLMRSAFRRVAGALLRARRRREMLRFYTQFIRPGDLQSGMDN